MRFGICALLRRSGWMAAAILLLAFATGPGAHAGQSDDSEENHRNFAKALKEGVVGATFRYRFENVTDDAPLVADKDGNASTLRSTLYYRSARFRGFNLFAEVEDVTDIGLEDDHGNGGAGGLSNGVTDRPTVADPDSTEFNQVYLRHSGFPDTTITAGRQELVWGNHRFVGNVGFRQNHQSFDGVNVEQRSIPLTTLNYAFLTNANRINGGNKALAGHLLNGEVKLAKTGVLTPYVYQLDFDEPGDAGLSTLTYGARWQDKREVGGGWSIPYAVELAQQKDAGDNANVDAGYVNVEVGGAMKHFWVRAGYELLEGSATDGAFTTPLATLHKFNGWADKFLNTPAAGLEDLYLAVGGGAKGFKGMLIYHDFGADSTSASYGKEIDAQVTYRAHWGQLFGAAIGFYDADTFAADTDKIWVWTAYSF